jgi:hypothetical protein
MELGVTVRAKKIALRYLCLYHLQRHLHHYSPIHGEGLRARIAMVELQAGGMILRAMKTAARSFRIRQKLALAGPVLSLAKALLLPICCRIFQSASIGHQYL